VRRAKLVFAGGEVESADRDRAVRQIGVLVGMRYRPDGLGWARALLERLGGL